MPYGKIKDNDIEYAPINLGNIINFNSNIELMKKHGYKLVNTDGKEPEYDERYQRIELIWKENDSEIYKTFVVIDNKPYEQALKDIKNTKHQENTDKAKQAIEYGYVIFKDAQFETNSQTVGDLTATMLMLGDEDVYYWLSKDDKVVELNKLDFVELGKLIAGYKNSVWNNKYVGYKEQIDQVTEIYELDDIIIDYTSNTEPEELPEEVQEEVQENEDVNNG